MPDDDEVLGPALRLVVLREGGVLERDDAGDPLDWLREAGADERDWRGADLELAGWDDGLEAGRDVPRVVLSERWLEARAGADWRLWLRAWVSEREVDCDDERDNEGSLPVLRDWLSLA